jgi:hypothetical protein
MNGRHLTPLMLLFPGLILTACAPLGPSGTNTTQGWFDPQIKFSAAAGATEITVESDNQGCEGAAGTKKGCVEFPAGKFGTIQFDLNPGGSKRCSDSPQADWVITKVELSAFGDPTTEKGVFGGKQPGWLKNAFLGVNRNDGVVYEATNSVADTTVTLINLNNQKRGNAKDIYYQITASNCDATSPTTIQIDPMVKNKGR